MNSTRGGQTSRQDRTLRAGSIADSVDDAQVHWHKGRMDAAPLCIPRRTGVLAMAAAAATLASTDAAWSARDDAHRLPGNATTIEHCVGGPAIRFEPGTRRALLEPADAADVSAALVQRYPIVARDGLAPERIVLWRHPRAGWLYVALVTNPDDVEQVCFTATFSAKRLPVTPPLLVKYFGADIVNE